VSQPRAVFLDRDGVLNRAIVREGKPYPPACRQEMELVMDAASCLERLKDMGFQLIVVTNQPDVARGTQKREEVEAMHAWMQERLAVDEFRVCYHDDGEQCQCRKPKAGLLMEAMAEHGLDLARSYMVGDRWRDIDAGATAGCRTVWIDSNYNERGPSRPADVRVKSLAEAVDWIYEQERKDHG